uniref:SGNH hydrolase-type esterase domain-containing protein n=1 Tax=Oryzias latipes TaxID=8090 RepID=A0A3B3HQ22_ORYLA
MGPPSPPERPPHRTGPTSPPPHPTPDPAAEAGDTQSDRGPREGCPVPSQSQGRADPSPRCRWAAHPAPLGPPPSRGVAATAATSPLPGGSPHSSAASPARATGVTPTPACPPVATGPLTSAARSRGRGDPPGSFVVGTSMVRHVRVNGSRTFCHPGALVRDITNSAHQLSLRNPSTHTIIVHAGVNDLKLQQSETLKKDFITLINSIKQLDKQCIISGPLPSPRFGDIKFSRLRQLHIWHKGRCLSNNIPYVDNFTTFFDRPNLFKPDGIHPNQTGLNFYP